MTKLILGSLEEVSIPTLGVTGILAKVDTGAFSGALHCTDIRVERRDDEATLYFTPLGRKELTTSINDFEERIVRSASGHEEVRYLIPVEIDIRGELYPTTIGLTDRASMRRDMLLGRRFLLEHDAIVDVSLTRDMDDEADILEEES